MLDYNDNMLSTGHTTFTTKTTLLRTVAHTTHQFQSTAINCIILKKERKDDHGVTAKKHNITDYERKHSISQTQAVWAVSATGCYGNGYSHFS